MLTCDWTDEKTYLIHHRMLKFHVRQGMVIEKIIKILHLNRIKWLEKYTSFNTQKRNRAEKDFEKDFSKKLVNSAFGIF